MNILITGAAGHIGSFFVDNIQKIKKIKKVYFLDNLSNQRFNIFFNLKKSKYFFLYKDLTYKNSLKDLKNIDIVIHFASKTTPEESLLQKNFYYKNNLGCFNTVVNFCIKNKSKLIHISSTSVYNSKNKIIDEDTKVSKTNNIYANIKIIEEQILRKKSNKLKYITLRFGTVVGCSRGMRFQTAANKFCFNTLMGIPIPIWKNSLNQIRPYLSITDAFKTIKYIIEKDLFKNDIFNILTQNYSVKDIISLIKEYKYKPTIKFINSKIMNSYSYIVSKEKITRLGLNLGGSIKNDIQNNLSLFKHNKLK